MNIDNEIMPQPSEDDIKQLKAVIGFFDGLRPIENITVSEWADKYRYLSAVSASEHGRYRTDRTPYMRKIMDCLSDYSPYEKVVFMKATQIGASEAACNFVGYVIQISPAPTLYVMPTGDQVDTLSKMRIDTLIDACPELSSRVSAPKSRDGKNTITMKTFPNGLLRLTGANSAAGLRSTPMRNLILDEPDAYPLDVDGEGNPIDLAIERTNTFEGKKKIFILSTPTIAGMSVIEREFFGKVNENGDIVGGTDQNYYHVPCPHCGSFQRLVFEQLKWTAGKPETAQYCCVHCGEMIDERFKTQMLLAGEWMPEFPNKSNEKVIGFHLNGLYSPYGWKSWETIATKWEEAQGVREKLKVFVNTTLAECWQERGESPEYKNLYNRRENYQTNIVPSDVCFLTAGVDVQKDRLELEIVGWCKDKRSYSIDYRVIEGDTARLETWDKLSEVVNERFKRDYTEMPIRLMAVDSGYNTTHVYAFCRRFQSDRVVAIKGQDSLGMVFSAPKTVDVTKAGKKIGKIRQYNVGSSFLKSELYTWLRLEKDETGTPPPCYCHFPQYDEHYFRGITAEEQVRKIVRGYPRFEWHKKYDRNEPLDCRNYARAAAAIVGLDRLKPEQLEAMSGKNIPKPAKITDSDSQNQQENAPKRRKRSTYWD